MLIRERQTDRQTDRKQDGVTGKAVDQRERERQRQTETETERDRESKAELPVRMLIRMKSWTVGSIACLYEGQKVSGSLGQHVVSSSPVVVTHNAPS